MPYCTDLWTDGNTVPKEYGGCYDEEEDTIMASASYDCEDGRTFVSHPPGYGFEGEPVNVTPAGLEEPDTDSPEYETLYDACVNGGGSSGSASGSASTGEQSSFADGVLTTPELKIQVTRHKVIKVGQKGNEYGDKPVIAFWYKITNLTDEDIDPLQWIFVMKAIQDNNPNSINELEVGALPDEAFLDSQTETIKKGGMVENAVAYELDDLVTPVDLVATEGLDEVLGETTYELE